MSNEMNKDQAEQSTELSDDRLEQASGGGGMGNDVLLGDRGNEDVEFSTSGDADDRPTEEVAFYYNKIAFQHARTTDGKE